MRLALGILVGVLVMIPRPSLAQTAGSSDDTRAVVDVNLFGTAASLSKGREFQSRFIRFGEIGRSFATYPKPSRSTPFPLVDVGGTFRLNRWTEVGANYSRVAHDDVADLSATIPHPTFFGAPATNTGVTGEALTRREVAANLFLALVPVRTARAEWRVMGGPTFFWLSADMVNEVLYAQTFDPLSPQQNITISGYTTSSAEGSDLGFHAGTDFTFFLTNIVGVAGGVRFSRGTVTVDREPLSTLNQEFRVGGTLGFVGLRFRLGR